LHPPLSPKDHSSEWKWFICIVSQKWKFFQMFLLRNRKNIKPLLSPLLLDCGMDGWRIDDHPPSVPRPPSSLASPPAANAGKVVVVVIVVHGQAREGI
jgi:hypothetical protein